MASGRFAGSPRPPRRRVTRATSQSVGKHEQRRPAERLQDVPAADVTELVGDHDVDLAAREATVEQRVPEHDVRGRAEAGRERVRLVVHDETS